MDQYNNDRCLIRWSVPYRDTPAHPPSSSILARADIAETCRNCRRIDEIGNYLGKRGFIVAAAAAAMYDSGRWPPEPPPTQSWRGAHKYCNKISTILYASVVSLIQHNTARRANSCHTAL